MGGERAARMDLLQRLLNISRRVTLHKLLGLGEDHAALLGERDEIADETATLSRRERLANVGDDHPRRERLARRGHLQFAALVAHVPLCHVGGRQP